MMRVPARAWADDRRHLEENLKRLNEGYSRGGLNWEGRTFADQHRQCGNPRHTRRSDPQLVPLTHNPPTSLRQHSMNFSLTATILMYMPHPVTAKLGLDQNTRQSARKHLGGGYIHTIMHHSDHPPLPLSSIPTSNAAKQAVFRHLPKGRSSCLDWV